MAFNSLLFIFLFAPLFFALYFAAPVSQRNAVCLVMSLFFYAWAEPVFVLVVVLSSFADHCMVRVLARTRSPFRRKLLVGFAVGQGLLLLIYFKYIHFLYTVAAGALGFAVAQHDILSPALPLAISFVTFEKITYVVDNYRGDGHPARTFFDYLTYVFLFPKLIAGPIVKYREIEPDLHHRTVSVDDFSQGALRFALGLSKKVLIADALGTVADQCFGVDPNGLPSNVAWIGVVCFSFQIYFDFSGYSDMAIGLARMMGFRLRENFNQPYLAVSFTDFWHRWHISLSTWIRDYLYIPLGGNRVPAWRVHLNLLICFVLSGFWHGANWTFLLWGLYHGAFLGADRVGLADALRRFPHALGVAFTFLLVMFGWVLFRATSLTHALGYFSAMFSFSRDLPVVIFPDQKLIVPIAVACLISFVPESTFNRLLSHAGRFARDGLHGGVIVIAFLWAVGRVAASTFTPFLYFRF